MRKTISCEEGTNSIHRHSQKLRETCFQESRCGHVCIEDGILSWNGKEQVKGDRCCTSIWYPYIRFMVSCPKKTIWQVIWMSVDARYRMKNHRDQWPLDQNATAWQKAPVNVNKVQRKSMLMNYMDTITMVL